MSERYKVGDIVQVKDKDTIRKAVVVGLEDYFVGNRTQKGYAQSEIPYLHQQLSKNTFQLFNQKLDGYENYHKKDVCYRVRFHDLFLPIHCTLPFEETGCYLSEELVFIGTSDELSKTYPYKLIRFLNYFAYSCKKFFRYLGV